MDLHGRPEPSTEYFLPGITFGDEQGGLLIEIRVSHAVDDTKAAVVRQGVYRTIEIDLPRMAVAMSYDMESFKNQVCFQRRTGPGYRIESWRWRLRSLLRTRF